MDTIGKNQTDIEAAAACLDAMYSLISEAESRDEFVSPRAPEDDERRLWERRIERRLKTYFTDLRARALRGAREHLANSGGG